MADRIRLEWRPWESHGALVAIVPSSDWRGKGHFHLLIQRRPGYCDRGRWFVIVGASGVSELDHQEGFPRYYFDLTRAKEEMEDWVNAREECRSATKGEPHGDGDEKKAG